MIDQLARRILQFSGMEFGKERVMGNPWRRRRWAALILSGVVVAGAAGMDASSHPPGTTSPRTFARANEEKIGAYVVLLRLRHDLFLRWKETGKWPDDKEANAALAAHGEYWAGQLKDGRAVLAGGMGGDYWDNVALIVFEAATDAEAQRIVDDDPAVRTYVFQAQVRPFEVHFISNKYGAE